MRGKVVVGFGCFRAQLVVMAENTSRETLPVTKRWGVILETRVILETSDIRNQKKYFLKSKYLDVVENNKARLETHIRIEKDLEIEVRYRLPLETSQGDHQNFTLDLE